MESTSPPTPKISPSAKVTRRYPEFINTDAVLTYLKEVHGQVDTLAFNLRSTLNNIVTGNAQTNEPQEDVSSVSNVDTSEVSQTKESL